jgi:hypothetical protein
VPVSPTFGIAEHRRSKFLTRRKVIRLRGKRLSQHVRNRRLDDVPVAGCQAYIGLVKPTKFPLCTSRSPPQGQPVVEVRCLGIENKRRDEMRRVAVALIVLVGSIGVLNLATPARAASVCLAGGSNNALRCDYASFEECRATASGGLGYCVRNPASVFDANASYRRSPLWRHSFGLFGAVTREDRSFRFYREQG